jgi:hypothetical protein
VGKSNFLSSNFLGNAERGEFQELTASQAVEMEKSNVHIETARAEQVRLEVEASYESTVLSETKAGNALGHVESFRTFDSYATEQEAGGFFGGWLGALGTFVLTVAAPGVGTAVGLGAMLKYTGEMTERFSNMNIAQAERQLELENLVRSLLEAQQEFIVAQRQLAAASGRAFAPRVRP